MDNLQYPWAVIIAAVTLVVGLTMVGLAASEAVGNDGTGQVPGEVTVMSETDSRVDAEVSCVQNRVELTSPPDHRYDVTVTVANLTAGTNEVSSTTIGTVEGNETVSFSDAGIVYVFVQEPSSEEPSVPIAVVDCSSGSNGTDFDTRTRDSEPAIRIDCAEDAVRFTAADETDYVAKVAVAAVSPGHSNSRSVTKTLTGNATIPLDEEGLVAAFASTGELGDNRTVSAMYDCLSDGNETARSG